GIEPAEETESRDRLGLAILALLGRGTAPTDEAAPRTERRPRVRQRQRPMEARWHQFLLYPFHDLRLWVGPAALLTALCTAGLLIAPQLLARRSEDPAAQWILGLSGLLGLFL